ncbi:MAG: PKD domain-containing protein, partial [Actinomycetota bacterium]
MAAGAGHSLALTADGNVWAWGTNQSGQLGDGTRRRRSQPVPILDRGNIVTIAAGGTHSLAVDSEGNVWAWGNNFRGTLGDGTTDDQLAPVRLAALSNIIAVAASKGMSYALRSDGQVFGWGVFTPLWVRVPDDGPIYTVDTLTPVPIPTSDGFLTGIRAIAAGGDELTGRNGFLALDEDNRVWHAYDASFLRGQDPVGMEVKEGLPDIREIAVGGVDSVTARLSSPQDETFYLALDGENRVWSWGENRRNQLGRETPDRRDDIPAIIPNLGNVSSIAAGGEFAMAAVVGDPVTGSPEGSVWIWGDNGVGQGGGLGFDGAIQEPTPIHPLSALLINNEFDGVRIIAAGASHAMAVSVGRHLNACTEPGTGRDLGSRVYAWGSNIDGRRGDGTGIDALGATPVLTLGDDDSCVSDIGHRLIVYKQGLGSGEVTSDTEGTDPTSGIDQSFFCRGIMCWQNVPAGTTVTLTAVPDAGSSSSDSQWQWDCSTLAGLMTVSVQVNGPTHCKIRFIRGESEEPQDPQDPPPELLASFTVVPNPAVVDASIVFDAAGSSGDIASYQWDFNDDGTFDASGESVVHSYPAAGSYLARLRVSDTEGNSSETTESVSVTEASTQTALLIVPGSG